MFRHRTLWVFLLFTIGPILVAGVLLGWVSGFSVLWAVFFALLAASGVYGAYRRKLEPELNRLRGQLRRIWSLIEPSPELPPGINQDPCRALEQELGVFLERVQKELDRLRQLETYRREFLGDVSHELKTPIHAIQGYLETLRDGALEDPEVNRRFLERALFHVGRLTSLVSDLIEISRIETGERRMNLRYFRLEPLLREVAETFELASQQKGIRLQYEPPEAQLMVLGDRDQIRLVVQNLLDNAIKYTDPGGEVRLFVRREPVGKVTVFVQDTGCGIPPEHLPRITERFYRVDKSRSRAQGGTGLGLAIVKHIIEAHRQQLIIESEVGRGSSFGFTLSL
jgi:two-component system phosphate regulon sensor histidine kinase PhoR